MTFQTHKEVFTTYLKEAQRDGNRIIENWIDWKDANGLAQCEECKIYGDYGSEVYHVDDNEIRLCDDCQEENTVDTVDITTRINNWVGTNGYSFFYLSDLEEIFDNVSESIIQVVKGNYRTQIGNNNTFLVS